MGYRGVDCMFVLINLGCNPYPYIFVLRERNWMQVMYRILCHMKNFTAILS